MVRGYDDQGRAKAVAGASVSGSGLALTTGPTGRTEPFVAEGQVIRARKAGLVPSFAERVTVP